MTARLRRLQDQEKTKSDPSQTHNPTCIVELIKVVGVAHNIGEPILAHQLNFAPP